MPQSVAGLAGAAAVSMPRSVSAQSQSRVTGANRRVRVGLIGCGGMGTSDLRQSLRLGAQVSRSATLTTPRAQRRRTSSAGTSRQTPSW